MLPLYSGGPGAKPQDDEQRLPSEDVPQGGPTCITWDEPRSWSCWIHSLQSSGSLCLLIRVASSTSAATCCITLAGRTAPAAQGLTIQLLPITTSPWPLHVSCSFKAQDYPQKTHFLASCKCVCAWPQPGRAASPSGHRQQHHWPALQSQQTCETLAGEAVADSRCKCQVQL